MSQHQRVQGLDMKRSRDVYPDLLGEGEGDTPGDGSGNADEGVATPVCNDDILPDEFKLCVRTAGENLWVTGVVARGDTDIQEATRMAMDQVKAAVSGKDWDMSKIALVCLYVQRMEDFAKVNSIYKTYFGLNPPVRVCVQASLPKNITLLMDCYGSKAANRSTMHVQGISHWAPANIGPYSQAVTVDSRIFIAGQIAMVPGSLKIIQGGIAMESRLSLRHVRRVLGAQCPGCDLRNVVTVVCYVTSHHYIDTARREWTRARQSCHEDTDNVDNEDGLSSPSVVCVVIPYLPRNAKVEWQVTAFTSGLEVKENSESCVYGDYTSTARCITSCGDIPGFSCTGYTDTKSPSLPVNMEAAVRCLCKCYRDVTSSQSPSGGCVPPLRIFYRVSQFSYAKLCQAFGAVLEEGESVHFALVPVSDLPSNHSVFSYCQ